MLFCQIIKTIKNAFSDTMADLVFVKAECGTLDVKEEHVEEEDPLAITPISEKGSRVIKNSTSYYHNVGSANI